MSIYSTTREVIEFLPTYEEVMNGWTQFYQNDDTTWPELQVEVLAVIDTGYSMMLRIGSMDLEETFSVKEEYENFFTNLVCWRPLPEMPKFKYLAVKNYDKVD